MSDKTKQAKNPKIRFKREDGTDYPDWERMQIGDLFYRVQERNKGQFDKTKWISVARMFYQEPDKVTSNNIDTRTYVLRLGDMAFEGHPNADFLFGRFVVDDIGDGIISELFPIYRHKTDYVLGYWKHAIQIERVMAPIYSRSITSSGASSNKLNESDFLREYLNVPSLDEQARIATLFAQLDALVSATQDEINGLKELKRTLLKKIFDQTIRFTKEDGTEYPEWESKKLGKLATVIMGQSPQGSTLNTDKIGLPLIQGKADLHGYGVIPERYTAKPTKIALDTDIIMTVRAPVGFVDWTGYKACIGRGVCALRSVSGDNRFLYYLLESLTGAWRKIEQGSTFTAISTDDIKTMKVSYPVDPEEQARIATLFESLDEAIHEAEVELEKYQELKKALMQKMFV